VGAGELGAAAGADATAGPDAAAASNTAAGLDAAAGLGAAAGADAAAGPDVAAELGGAAEPAAVAGPRGLAREAVAALLGRPVGSAPVVEVPGRLEQVDEAPLEIWDGAHNPAGVAYLAAHLPPRQDWTLVLSILRDKDTEAMLARFGRLGSRLVATSSDAARALPAAQLANRARPFFAEIEAVDSPQEARRRARSLAGPEGAVLVSGSLTLVGALAVVRPASVR
jgi:dihydrofolate synthase/folylpolyglutamate synthase